MELHDAIRRRRMVRSFQRGRAVEPDVLDQVLDAARRVPSAGNTQGVDLLVLDDEDDRVRFWDASFPDGNRRVLFRWQGLFDAPVIVVPVVEPGAYARRYSETDKVSTSGLDEVDGWPVPYWFVDGGMAVQNVLLAAVGAGLGALFFGLFEREAATLYAFGVPASHRALGAIALGHPAPDAPGRSAGRPRRPLADVVHRGSW